MEDAVARYRAASERNDIEAVMETLADDVELVSPVSAHLVFRGRDDVRTLLTAVYATLRDWHWRQEVGDGAARVVVGDGRAGPVKLGDAMVFELAEDGQIRRIRPYLRPWFALTVFALILGPKVARHPGVVRRALRSG